MYKYVYLIFGFSTKIVIFYFEYVELNNTVTHFFSQVQNSTYSIWLM